jgi:RimJ/RimL family protein N-acetyltransferase
VRSFPSVVETPRLLIRPNDPATAEAVNAAVRASFKELQAWMPWAERMPSVEETRRHLTETQEHYRDGTDCSLGLWLKDSGAFVGASGLHPRPIDPT